MFVGDPVAYGWDGPKYAYKGPHPIQIDVVVGGDPDEEYWYLDGPHYRKAERNGDTLDPVSVRAGVVTDGWLPHTARAMADPNLARLAPSSVVARVRA